ncbi:unnamed protein product [Notodromas monacha]|uniref:BTB domain-containing protein n=1 Tax=Notodromas monacha TaxID=399045 RepID=A0A7R9BPF6_9CRUS|nr:unnamed protein product [Notodromas monacha]CAG0919227.1 unnamed protein product [Notodromas monacha]
MGLPFSRSRVEPRAERRHVRLSFNKGTKRKISDPEPYNDDPSLPIKRVRVPETGNFIYDTLFKAGVGSDVTVKALGQEWKLHRIYLQQSPFFQAMFHGGWKDADNDVVELKIVDGRVSAQGLDIALGSMYHGEVDIPREAIVNVVAACRLLQLEHLLAKCGDLMVGAVNGDNAVSFLAAGDMYGVGSVKTAALTWLAQNAFPISNADQSRCLAVIWNLSLDTLETVLASEDLVVIPCEMILYSMLCVWVYIQEAQVKSLGDGEDGVRVIMNDAIDFFLKKQGTPFLLTAEGRKYGKIFELIKVHQLVMHPLDVQCLRRDNVLDPDTIYRTIETQWIRQLHLSVERPLSTVEMPSLNVYGDQAVHTRDGGNWMGLKPIKDTGIWAEEMSETERFLHMDMESCELSNESILIVCVDLLEPIVQRDPLCKTSMIRVIAAVSQDGATITWCPAEDEIPSWLLKMQVQSMVAEAAGAAFLGESTWATLWVAQLLMLGVLLEDTPCEALEEERGLLVVVVVVVGVPTAGHGKRVAAGFAAEAHQP